jgi:seryl-tRNA synthetase
MQDIEDVRQNPDAYRRAIANKGLPLELDQLLAVDKQKTLLKARVDSLRHERNVISEKIAKGEIERQENIPRARQIGDQLTSLETEWQEASLALERLMAIVPSLPAASVPIGASEEENLEIRRVGNPLNAEFPLRDHLELARLHKMIELDGAREIAGSGAYALVGAGVLLEMAVLRMAFDMTIAKGFQPVMPPLLVKQAAMFGTGYFPLGQDEAYAIERDGLYLPGTSEVGLVAMHMGKTMGRDELPIRLVGMTPCFRREAGAAGRDTKGFYRVHQFQKVEQVVFCENDPQVSEREQAELLNNAEEIMQALELPYRVVASCTGELGLGQVRKHDIEAWMPSRNAYGETHSCSSFHEFQARRLRIRYHDQDKKPFVHTLNCTAIASPRILIALLENHQNADGTIRIPLALRPYLGMRSILE